MTTTKQTRVSKQKLGSAKTPTAAMTKSETVIQLLRRSKGATVADLQKATGWQAHSVRGFLSGTLRKRMGLTINSERSDSGIRRYRLIPG